MIHIFLVVDGEWVMLMIILALVTFVPRSYVL
jgi:hypothetical protein